MNAIRTRAGVWNLWSRKAVQLYINTISRTPELPESLCLCGFPFDSPASTRVIKVTRYRGGMCWRGFHYTPVRWSHSRPLFYSVRKPPERVALERCRSQRGGRADRRVDRMRQGDPVGLRGRPVCEAWPTRGVQLPKGRAATRAMREAGAGPATSAKRKRPPGRC